MKEQEGLYFIAINLSQKVSEVINYYKRDFAERFQSREALKGFPHITLKHPFKFSNNSQGNLVSWFNEKIEYKTKPFEIELKDFGAFHNKYNPVVYVKPTPNLPLYSLQQEIIRSFSMAYPDKIDKAFESKFNPHVTIAYRDLSPESFKQAWDKYRSKKFSATFEVSGFHLLQHDRKQWNIINTFRL